MHRRVDLQLSRRSKSWRGRVVGPDERQRPGLDQHPQTGRDAAVAEPRRNAVPHPATSSCWWAARRPGGTGDDGHRESRELQRDPDRRSGQSRELRRPCARSRRERRRRPARRRGAGPRLHGCRSSGRAIAHPRLLTAAPGCDGQSERRDERHEEQIAQEHEPREVPVVRVCIEAGREIDERVDEHGDEEGGGPRSRAGRGRVATIGTSQIRNCGESTFPNARSAHTQAAAYRDEPVPRRRVPRAKAIQRATSAVRPTIDVAPAPSAPWPPTLIDPCENARSSDARRSSGTTRRAPSISIGRDN